MTGTPRIDVAQVNSGALPQPTRHVPAAEVLRFRDHAFNLYSQSAGYLEMVEREFGSATVGHLREMAAHKLERLYA